MGVYQTERQKHCGWLWIQLKWVGIVIVVVVGAGACKSLEKDVGWSPAIKWMRGHGIK